MRARESWGTELRNDVNMDIECFLFGEEQVLPVPRAVSSKLVFAAENAGHGRCISKS